MATAIYERVNDGRRRRVRAVRAAIRTERRRAAQRGDRSRAEQPTPRSRAGALLRGVGSGLLIALGAVAFVSAVRLLLAASA